MDWLQFLQIVAVPAFGITVALTVWCYRDNRSTIRFNEQRSYDTSQRHEKEMADLRQAQSQMTLAIVEKYASKDELYRMESKILNAIGDIKRSIDLKGERSS